MDSHPPDHLSDEQLARCREGELATEEAAHLNGCTECCQRLRDMAATTAAYMVYRDSMRAPLLPPAPKPWPTLAQLIAQQQETGRESLSHGSAAPQPATSHEMIREILSSGPAASRPAASPSRKIHWLWVSPLAAGWAFRWLWVPALAAACTLIWTQVVRPRRLEQTVAQANELLNRSARVELPPGRMIALRTHGRTILRPAVLNSDSLSVADPDLAHLQSVFRRSRYSWREPLSPRSFQAWRSGVKNRKDSVTEIGQSGSMQFYRVRTDDPEGLLRSASLTLRAGDLRPTDADFEFRGEAPLAMEEPPGETVRRLRPPAKGAAVETRAGPEDTLHVLAALDEIGADAGEPIEVTADAGHRHVVVRAGGLGEERRREIAKALDSLPHVSVDFESAALKPLPLPGREKRGPAPPANENSIPAPLRQRFEARLGGAVAVQEATDRSLDASASTLARVHALEVLALNFPPETEARLSGPDRLLLGRLRQRHVAELEKSLSQIQTSVHPLLEPGGAARSPAADEGRASTWQAGIPSLAAAARETDRLLNRLLAGSYSQSSGEQMLSDLAPSLQRLEESIQSQGKRP